jgi:hypothetical protein
MMGTQRMDNDHLDQDLDVRARIARFTQANEHAREKEVTAEELQTLKTAAERLDQLLRDAEEANSRILSAAATRLDQLLADIAVGKDVVAELRLRRDPQNVSE